MSSRPFLVTLTVASTFLLFNTAFGQKSTLQGEVIGVDGRPSKAAQVRIERQDKKTAPIVAVVDQRGHLASMNLDAGTYKLTATVEGGVKSSQTIKVQANKPASVAFDMRKTSAVASKTKKRYVWVPAETGSHLGGRWVEVGEEPMTGKNGQNVETVNGASLEKFNRQTFTQAPPANGGR